MKSGSPCKLIKLQNEAVFKRTTVYNCEVHNEKRTDLRKQSTERQRPIYLSHYLYVFSEFL